MALAAGTLTPVSASNNNAVITVVLSWLTATGGTGPYTYAIQRSGSSGFVPFGTYVSGLTGLTETLTTPTYFLPPGSNFYRILVTDSLGATALSNIAALPVPSVLVAQPLTVVAVGANAKLTYAPSVGGIGPPFTYDVQRSPNSDMSSATDLGNHVSPYTDVAPPAGVNYYRITVTDTNSPVADTASSNIAAFGTAPATMSETGVNLKRGLQSPIGQVGLFDLYGYVMRCTLIKTLGDKFAISCDFKTVGTTVSGFHALMSATFDCWDQNNNQLVTAFPISMIEARGKNWCRIRFVMRTGPGKIITTPGTYTYQFTINTCDGGTTIFQQIGLVNPAP